MRRKIALSFQQKTIMGEFYASAPAKVVYDKKQRNKLWKTLTNGKISAVELAQIENKCPAMHHQIARHYASGDNIQSAVFSECAYAQTLANIFGLCVFRNCYEDAEFLPKKIRDFLESYALVPRYVYQNGDGTRMLIQAGGCGGVDSALITVIDFTAYTIEFKEPGAKASEPDLPKYGEDGKLKITHQFLENYPQFGDMLNEQKNLNFFSAMGGNVNDFSHKSINTAIVGNYAAKKFADVVCTEDVNGYLVMLPINQVHLWAEIEGEIRPAGRNAYSVWTPNALSKILGQKGATIDNGIVRLPQTELTTAKPRGGSGVSRYKINSLFFVRAAKCRKIGSNIEFSLSDVRQLNPTITAKMFFKNLKYEEVREHYFGNNN